MRIGLVCPYSFSHPGGVQNQVLGLAGWLNAQGHQIAICAPGPVPVAALAAHGLGERQFTSTGAALPIAWNGSVARVAGGPRTGWVVRRWLRAHDFDLLHLQEPVTPSPSLWALLLSAATPVVATFHVATPRSRVLRLAGGLVRRRTARIAVPIAVSPVAAEVVCDHLGLAPEVIPNALAMTEFEGPNPRRADAPPRVTFLGRLDEPRKGLDVLLEALPAVRAAVPEVEVMVIGPGERSLPAGILRVRNPTDAERAELLRGSTVYVAPHLGRESFGIVLLEAMAAGVPIVASDLPAFVDVLTDGSGEVLGETFSTGDSDALAAAVIRVIGNPGVRDSERDPGKLRAHARQYDWSVVGPQILARYAAAATHRAGRGRGQQHQIRLVVAAPFRDSQDR